MSPLLVLALACLLTSPPGPHPWLLYTEQARDEPRATLVAARPGERHTLLGLDVLPNHAPHARLSPEGRTLFLVRHTAPNHLERTGELLAFDLARRALRSVAHGVDAEPPLALSDEAVAWFETIEVRPAEIGSRALDRVTISLRASIGGQVTELARLAGIYGVHFAGIADSGIVLYVVAPEEAAFYLLPLDEQVIRASRAPVRQARAGRPSAKADIEARDDAIPAAGLVRLAAAPTGPVAREFNVRGRTLFFGALTRDRAGSALYSLDIPDLADLAAHRAGSATALAAQELTLTGRRSPGPLVARDRVIFGRAGASGESLQSRPLAGQAAEGRAAMAAPSRREERTLVHTRGTLRALAIDAGARAIAVRRTFDADSELLWIDLATSQVRRLRPQELYEVIGFAEAIE